MVNIPDENLEQAIRDELEKPTGYITVADMEELTVLDARRKIIEELIGLEYAKNMGSLYLEYNSISDITRYRI